MIVADSDVLIDWLRGEGGGVESVGEALESGTLATTTITAFELLSGARTETQRESIDALLAPLPRYPFDRASATTAAGIRRELESKGLGIGMADYMIAGICLERGATLLTRNREHFGRVASLVLSPFE